jgi:hypothetical protein
MRISKHAIDPLRDRSLDKSFTDRQTRGLYL